MDNMLDYDGSQTYPHYDDFTVDLHFNDPWNFCVSLNGALGVPFLSRVSSYGACTFINVIHKHYHHYKT